MWWDNSFGVEVLLGKTLSEVTRNGEMITFYTTDGEGYRLCHHQDCCESVTIEDICGDLNDLVGSPVLMAEEATNRDDPPKEHRAGDGDDEYRWTDDSYTWTFYRFATVKGAVTIRWYGTSNGYYSESVNFWKL